MDSEIQPKQKEHGQSMVELALTITILMVLLAGTIDLGHAFFVWLRMRDAAQEGASYRSFCPTDLDGTELRVRDNLDLVNDYVVDPGPPVAAQGDTITVIVETDLPISMPFLGTIIGSDTIHIAATINDTVLRSTCPSP
jgi:Flp pilus assembly protein TadG